MNEWMNEWDIDIFGISRHSPGRLHDNGHLISSSLLSLQWSIIQAYAVDLSGIEFRPIESPVPGLPSLRTPHRRRPRTFRRNELP